MGGLTAAISRLLALPKNKRAIEPYSFAFGYWTFNSDKGITGSSGGQTFYTDLGVAGFCAGVWSTPWANNGLSLGKASWNKVLDAIGNSGGVIDWLFADVEVDGTGNGDFTSFTIRGITGLTAAFARNSNYTQSWNGVTSLSEQMAAEGATIGKINLPAAQSYDYVVWNKSVETFRNKLIDKVLWEPTVARYPLAQGSNYDAFYSGSTSDAPPDPNGHPEYRSNMVGSATSPVLYGEINQIETAWQISTTDSTRLLPGATTNPVYTVSRSPWSSFLITMQKLRSAKRNAPNIPLTPWIGSPLYTGGGTSDKPPPVGFADVKAGWNANVGRTYSAAGNSAYYYELVRHAALHGVKAFGYFNDYGTDSSGITAMALLLNNTLTEVNSKIGGFTLGVASTNTSRVDWLSKYLVSGAPAYYGSTYWWRATIKPGTLAEYVSTPDIVLSGTTVGTWIETSGRTAPEIKPFELKELFYFDTAHSNEALLPNGSTQSKFLGNDIRTISTFQGIPLTGNATDTPTPIGRAYNFEFNPVNPTQSSPWHNVLYELAIDPYKWGARSFMLYWAQGALNYYNYPFRYLELLDDGYYSSTTDAAYSPARVKGFTSAVKALLEGKLDPALNGKVGFTAINEPCNVMLYYTSINGFYKYRWGTTAAHPSGSTYYPGSLAFWDKCFIQTGSSAAANALFYSYLDRFVNDIVSMKGGPTSGSLSAVFDSMVNSATPGTIGQFSSLSSPYTRGLSYEMADWYVASKLKENGIATYVEARPLKEFSTLTASLTGGTTASLIPGICGATAISDWRNHLSVEYNIWFQNPDFNKTDPFIQRFVKDSETTSIFRWAQNTGPAGTSYDPYKVPLTISTGGTAFTMTYANGLTAWLYSPQKALFDLYAHSDVYRKFNNLANTGLTFFGVAYNHMTRGIITDYEAFARGSSGNNEVNSAFNNSSMTGYYRISTDIPYEGNRVGYARENFFNQASFVSNPTGYNTRLQASSTGTAGYWTPEGMTFWRTNVKQPSITGFIEMLRQVSISGIPIGGFSAGWVGATYPYDTFSNGVIPRSMRP